MHQIASELKIETLKIQLEDVSTMSNHTENTLRQTEHELVNTKMELYESMKKLVDARNEVSFLEKKLDDASEENYQEVSELKNEIVRLHQELRGTKAENSRLKGELEQRHTSQYTQNVRWASSDLQSNADTRRYDYDHGNSRRIPNDFYDTRGFIPAGERSYNHNSYGEPVAQISFNSRRSGNIGTNHSDEPKFRLPFCNGKTDFQSFWAIFQIGVKQFNWD